MNTIAQDAAPGEGEVANYLANRLSEEEAQAFELYCLQHPEFARHVERELALKTGLRELDQSVSPIRSPRRRRPYAGWPLALAASVVVLVSAVLVVRYLMHTQAPLVAFSSKGELPDPLRSSAVSQITLARMRGSEKTTQVSASVDGVVEIRFLPDLTSKSGDFSVQISAEAPSERSLTVKHLRPTADGYVQLYVPAAQMINGTWLVSVGEDANSGKPQGVEVFRVEFVAANGKVH